MASSLLAAARGESAFSWMVAGEVQKAVEASESHNNPVLPRDIEFFQIDSSALTMALLDGSLSAMILL